MYRNASIIQINTTENAIEITTPSNSPNECKHLMDLPPEILRMISEKVPA